MIKNYEAKSVSIQATRSLKSFTLTNNPDGSQVIDSVFCQQLFDRDGKVAGDRLESLTTTELGKVQDSITAIQEFLNVSKDASEK